MDELKAAAERILIASKDPSAGVWVWGDASFGDCALRCDMEILARHYLSPPAAGPGVDANRFVSNCRQRDRDGDWVNDYDELVAELRAALGTGEGDDGLEFPIGSRWAIDHDGFVGSVIGYYRRRDGKEGVVLQQDGTNVVHVYGLRWLAPASPIPAAPAPNEGGKK